MHGIDLSVGKQAVKKQLSQVLKRRYYMLYNGKIFNKTVVCSPHDNKISASRRQSWQESECCVLPVTDFLRQGITGRRGALKRIALFQERN